MEGDLLENSATTEEEPALENQEGNEGGENNSDDQGNQGNEPDEDQDALELVNSKDPRTRRAGLLMLNEKYNKQTERQEGNNRNDSRGTQQQHREPAAPKIPLIDRLKTKMGDQFDLIPEKFWDAFGEAFSEHHSSHRADFEDFRNRYFQDQAESAMERFYADHKEARKFENDLGKLATENPNTNGQPPYKYIKRLWYIFQAENPNLFNGSQQREQRNQQNQREQRRELPARSGNSQQPNRQQQPRQPKNLREAISMSVDELRRKAPGSQT